MASLKSLYESLAPAKRALQFGLETDCPLTSAFPQKRVVHAGINGEVIAPAESQACWQQLMQQPPVKAAMQAVYIHIPFCKTKCLYCGFFQNGMNQQVEDTYIDCLVAELEAASKQPRLRDGLIHAVFIGGGTPTSLSPANTEKLLQAIQRCLPLANDYELTLEGRIHDVVPEKMAVWFANGVNRISLGVQSFNTEVRRSVGRLDDKETVLERLQELMAYNQASIVIDLMYGLPGQTMEVWEEDLATLVASGIDGADLYQLNVFEGSDLNKAIAAGRLAPAATTKKEAQMFKFAKDYLDQRAYRRLNLCHWSRSGRERSLYNTMAKSGATVFPFGSGAGGFIDGYETMLHRAVAPYEMFVKQGKKPFMALVKQPAWQPLINQVQTEMEQGYLNLAKLLQRDERLQDLQELYRLWEERGLVHNNGALCVLTEAGQFWQVNLTQTTLECMQYLLTGNNKMSLSGVAAQDKPNPLMAEAMQKMKAAGANVEAMQKMAEMMRGMPPEQMRMMMKRMAAL